MSAHGRGVDHQIRIDTMPHSDCAARFEQRRDSALGTRAATSMARLWRDQGRRTEARELPTPIYRWFTEGFDTCDLKEAQCVTC